MIIALPLTENNEFSSHFGAAAKAGLIEVNTETKTILRAWSEIPPVPEPCAWVDWLAAQGVSCFLAGGMGMGAQKRMAAVGISVIVGVPVASPQELVAAWLSGALTSGSNACSGGHHEQSSEHHQHTHGHAHQSNGCGCSH